MPTLIRLTTLKGEKFYLNADQIITVHSINDPIPASLIYHLPYNRENGTDWVQVQETAEEIFGFCAPLGVL